MPAKIPTSYPSDKMITNNGNHRHDKPGHQSLRNGRVSLPHQMYLVTTATRQRQPVFLAFKVACAAARCFEDRTLLGDARMLAWVLMPDHVHWLVQVGETDNLSTVVNRLKSSSARQVNRLIGTQGPLWQKAFHDHALRADEDVRQIARYMVANPLRAGLVERIGDYSFWNAMWI